MSKSVVARWSTARVMDVASGMGGETRTVGDEGAIGFRPTELLLGSLAACTGMDVIDICRKKRQVIESYEVHVTGEQWDSIPYSFRSIAVEHRFRGTDIDPQAVVRAIELSTTHYCMISEQLARGEATIHCSYWIDDGSGSEPVDVLTVGPRGAGLEPRP